jgi:formate dehydrogenase subunit gamma
MSNRVLRFTRSERAVHWLTALAFFSLLISGLVVGRRGTFHKAMYAWHLASAGVLVGGVALVAIRGNRRALASSAHELLGFDEQDRRWLARAPSHLLAGTAEPAAGRFNAGQKLNFACVCILLAALYISGIDAIVAGTHHNLVFAVHKVATIAAGVLVAGHLYMAVINRGTRGALRGMISGDVDRSWAYAHYPRWTAAQADDGQSTGAGRLSGEHVHARSGARRADRK